MKKFIKVSAITISAVAITLGLAGPNTVFAATSPTLGAADSFSVLAKTAITDAGPANTSIAGDVGLDDTGAGITGLTSAAVAGTIYATDAAGPDGAAGSNPVLMTSAQAANTAAFGALDQVCDFTLGAGLVDLGGMNLIPGVYCAGSFGLTGVLTLTGGAGDVYIFKAATTLITQSDSSVTGGDACNVWWRVGSSATLGTNTSFTGNILALTSITLETGADLNGRALAQTGAVTLDGNTITEAVCLGASEDEDEDEDVDIKITKKASPSSLSGSGYVTYTYKVTNEGDAPLKSVSVKDNKCSPVEYVSGDSNHNSKLGVDEVWKYTCIRKVSQTETNKATARGTNGSTVFDYAKATVTVSPGFPNAGVGPDEETSAPWNIIIPASLFIALFSFYLARKKLAI